TPQNASELAATRKTDNIDNIDNIDNDTVIEAQAHSESNSDNALAEASKDAQVPEATIKMETVAPDVVVASLETPEDVDDTQPVDEFTNDNTDIDFTDTAEAFFQEKDKAEVSPADKTDSSQTNSNNIQPDKSFTKQSLQEDSKPSLNTENTDEKEDSKQNEQDVTQVQDSSQTSDRTVK